MGELVNLVGLSTGVVLYAMLLAMVVRAGRTPGAAAPFDPLLLATSLRVRKHRIAPSEYPAFRRFCLAVDAAVGQELVISHE